MADVVLHVEAAVVAVTVNRLFEGKNVGKTMRVHYKGTFNDGFSLILPTTVVSRWSSFAVRE